MLKIGAPAPDFQAEGTTGKIHLKSLYGKKNVILIFYEKDNDPLAVKQFAEIQNAYEEFIRMDTAIIGINPDILESHRLFSEIKGYLFPLVVDIEAKIAKDYDIKRRLDHPELLEHTTIIIDLDGVVCFSKNGYVSINELLNVIEHVL